jgi:hypothetical protein
MAFSAFQRELYGTITIRPELKIPNQKSYAEIAYETASVVREFDHCPCLFLRNFLMYARDLRTLCACTINAGGTLSAGATGHVPGACNSRNCYGPGGRLTEIDLGDEVHHRARECMPLRGDPRLYRSSQQKKKGGRE